MAEFAALPLFTDALLSDTGHLTDAEFGMYMRLLVLLWRSPDCRIPNDKAWIAKRLQRSPLEYDAEIAPIIEEFCQKDGNYIFQKRLAQEFEYTRRKVQRQKNGAKARWGNQNAAKIEPIENIENDGMQGETQTKRKKSQENADEIIVSDSALINNETDQKRAYAPTPTPTPTFKKEYIHRGNVSGEPPTDDLENWFQEKFWEPFPKQRAGAKDKALIAMKKALTKTTREEIENAVRNYATSDEVERGYAKGAAAWLNDERWTSDYRPAHQAQVASGQRHKPKASYMDKIHRSTEKARELLQARLDADHNQPWSQQPSEE